MSHSEDKSYILDPLTTICKLALLYFLPGGTKIGIGHHVLHLQGNTYFQWAERKYNGDTRNNIANLIIPLIKVIKWYVLDGIDKIKMDDTLNQSIQRLAQFAVKGLIKLQNETYESDIAIYVILQHFIDLLTNALDGLYRKENYQKFNNDKNLIADKIKNNFDPYIINSISKMLDDASKMIGDEYLERDMLALVDCVHKILVNRDEDFIRMMKEINTTL
jgi:hypothetical protein